MNTIIENKIEAIAVNDFEFKKDFSRTTKEVIGIDCDSATISVKILNLVSSVTLNVYDWELGDAQKSADSNRIVVNFSENEKKKSYTISYSDEVASVIKAGLAISWENLSKKFFDQREVVKTENKAIKEAIARKKYQTLWIHTHKGNFAIYEKKGMTFSYLSEDEFVNGEQYRYSLYVRIKYQNVDFTLDFDDGWYKISVPFVWDVKGRTLKSKELHKVLDRMIEKSDEKETQKIHEEEYKKKCEEKNNNYVEELSKSLGFEVSQEKRESGYRDFRGHYISSSYTYFFVTLNGNKVDVGIANEKYNVGNLKNLTLETAKTILNALKNN